MADVSNPFSTDESGRDPARRFRGRITASVTIATSGDEERRAGLTISSLFVVEGEPATVHMVVGPVTDLWDRMEETGSFVLHVCQSAHVHLADVFAGIRPSPGGMFVDVDIEMSRWGPIITRMPNRAMGRVEEMRNVGYSGVVVGTIEEVQIGDLADPLAYFRGSYRGLGPVNAR